jgi:peroxiredoxin
VQLCRDKEQYAAAGLQIVLVGLGMPQQARQFRDALDLPFMILSDPDKQSYRAFGLTRRLNLGREINAQSLSRFVHDVTRYGVGKTDQDMLQLGGVFVVDRAGIVRFSFAALRASDQPALADVIASAHLIGQG